MKKNYTLFLLLFFSFLVNCTGNQTPLPKENLKPATPETFRVKINPVQNGIISVYDKDGNKITNQKYLTAVDKDAVLRFELEVLNKEEYEAVFLQINSESVTELIDKKIVKEITITGDVEVSGFVETIKKKIKINPVQNGIITVYDKNGNKISGDIAPVEKNTVLRFELSVSDAESYEVKSLILNNEIITNEYNGKIIKQITVTENLEVSGTVESLYKNIKVIQPENGKISVYTKDGTLLTEDKLNSVKKNTNLTFTLAAIDSKLYRPSKLIINSEVMEKITDGKIVREIVLVENLDVTGEIKKLILQGGKMALDADGVKFNMINIGEVFDATIGDENRQNNQPRKVNLSAYQISETEVTQELYEKVMDENPSYFSEIQKVDGDIQRFRPVERVSWYEAAAFCNGLTKLVTGMENACVYYADKERSIVYGKGHAKNKSGIYPDWSKTGFRLPTEAEWEYAAMGGKSGKYAGSDNIDEVAWYRENATKIGEDYVTRQVALKEANGYGIYDMCGNVFEWCWDYWSNETPPGGTDPKGVIEGAAMSERGGCYGIYAEKCESSYREYDRPDHKAKFLGIRIAAGLE